MLINNQQTAQPAGIQSSLHYGVKLALEKIFAPRWVQNISAKLGAPPGLADYIHPCFIDQQQTLIHARDLAFRNPGLYEDLQNYAQLQGYQLLADRRQFDVDVARQRRRRWLPILTLSVGLSSAALADQTEHNMDEHTLALFDAPISASIEESSDVLADTAFSFEPDITLIDSAVAQQGQIIADILRQHYRPADHDPDYVNSDLQEMAEYFSRYPEAIELLLSLKDYPWSLRYKKDSFETQVRGNQIQVKAVNVNFDSRAAAQLRSHRLCHSHENRGACIASPADALLHELLHVKSALLEPEKFIEQGGLSSVLYPYAHEAAVIKSENRLYQKMTSLDGRYRPGRHTHTGRIVASTCATCLN
ncbi:hypothetical protein [Oceanicoccus sagamiensis]|uniref:Lysine-specific metallo-endopeptidase domain-containing protein n=1 Tax=Oceanicoccus sagamiensis TaxID=716816 RepID=A0A1X9NBF3_9GAMM|nr:hypothetical protein [Oceanicoccus sagamiensis]ARN73245.1 hypothetical protein BST96_03450 [Oceanicoccus sagamiensis]